MGRGLSELQKTILVTALENHRAEGRPVGASSGADCYYWEIMAGYFGWEPKEVLWDGKPTRMSGSKRFSKSQIGARKYNAAEVAVSRSVRRLEQRGLAVVMLGLCNWSGINLTQAGVEMAERLLANLSQNSAKDEPIDTTEDE